MRRTILFDQSTAIWLIALLLAANLAISHVWPFIALAIDAQKYLEAAKTCHKALSNLQQVQATSDQYDRAAADLLYKSAIIGTMDCYPREDLRHALLAQGVSEHKLNRIDLEARLSSNSGLRYFADGLLGE